MRNHLFLSTLFLFITLSLSANTDRYRLILTSDPATSITIGWDQISGHNPIVYYGTEDHGIKHDSYLYSKKVDRKISYRGMDNYFARLRGLLPNTVYYFVIKDSRETSKRFWFRTAPNDLSRLSFIAGGDSRNNRVPRQKANQLVSKLKPHAVFFGGDMTNRNNSRQWKRWFEDWQLTTSADGRMIPIIPARGNHENSTVIFNLFDTPNSDSYFAITFGDNMLRAYTLNSEISVAGNQKTWLAKDLNNHSSAQWKMAQYHKPMRPHTKGKSDGNSEYNAWAKLFYENNVRVVIDCDSHTAKTTWPIKPSHAPGSDAGFIRDNLRGTVYAGEGCWGAPLRRNNDDKKWTRNSGSFNQFKLIFMDTAKIEIRTIRVNNASSVGSVSNTDPFTLPTKLDVWYPSNGSVVEIFPAPKTLKPEIKFAANTATHFVDGKDVRLYANVLSPTKNIEHVRFYMDGSLLSSSAQAPFSFTNTYSNGQYIIEAIATNTTGATGHAELIINVGQYTKSVSLPIKDGDDDVEETEGGALYMNSSDLEMVYDDFEHVSHIPNGNQLIGLRFQNVNIPKGAIVTNTYLQFRSDETNSYDSELLISAEYVGSSASFENNFTSNISARTLSPVTSLWLPYPWKSKDSWEIEQQTSQLNLILQSLIDRSDWEAGNNVSFIIKGRGSSLKDEKAKRVADSYEGSPNFPPTLVYTYTYDAKKTGLKSTPKINIYPNPLKGTISFELSISDLVKIQISDLEGNNVYSQIHKPIKGKIQIQHKLKKAGVYLISVFSSDNTLLASKKMVNR